MGYQIECEVRTCEMSEPEYVPAEKAGLGFGVCGKGRNGLGEVVEVTLENHSKSDFRGVVHVKVVAEASEPKFFMPGYMYNRNTADMPSSGRKSFPRIRKDGSRMPESPFFMTRSDRLAEPVSIFYDERHVFGISGTPYIKKDASEHCSIAPLNTIGTSETLFCGFTCNLCDRDKTSVGYTLGYENAPWLFVQTATVLERKVITETGLFTLGAGEEFRFEIVVYDYEGEDERAVLRAIEDAYGRWHEAPRKIEGMTERRATELLSGAIRDYAWLPEEGRYTGFVYDRPEGLAYNKIPSVSWTNGLAVAVPMLLAANRLGDEIARGQSISFIDDMVGKCVNPASGFLYESETDGKPTVRGWWYDGMHSGGHSGYINGQAVYYILKAYENELKVHNTTHVEWLKCSASVVSRMNGVINGELEYPFAMSEHTGAGIEYDSCGSAWCLAASAAYVRLMIEERSASGGAEGSNCEMQDYGDEALLLSTLRASEKHYYEKYVRKVECYGGPLDTDKAVDSEGVLGYIRAVRLLHEITGEEYLLDHLRDALCYEFTFKLGYNTPVSVRPLSEVGWSSCGGSITSTANPHIHPMSSTVVSEMKYYLKFRDDAYVRSRMEDTIGWGLQTFNTRDGEYGYGRVGWMSERFCFCEGLLTEHYPDGEVASTWFALMPWASASVIEGFVR